MSEELRSIAEQEQVRKKYAFEATRQLLRNKESGEPIRRGLEKYFGKDESKIGIEMKGQDSFLADDTTMAVFNTERGLPYIVWGMITEQMKHNPDLTNTQFDDQEFLEKYLEELPENLYEAYARSGSVATY